jgi:methylated-DNA-[protein]-cysteine S-methyltransferase
MHRVVPSPLGPILLSTDRRGRLTGLRIGGALDQTARSLTDDAAVDGADAAATASRGLDDAATQLEEYFAGRRRSFDVALALDGTSFQRLVWAQLQTIPFGTTVSYGQLAAQLDRAGAARAVGHANGRNPIPIIVPCHRVIGSTGQLTGYGGGLEAKHTLLELESQRISSDRVDASA